MSSKISEGISVIIPVYNSEKYLAECLESIINQEYKNLEIICVNDGSTDSSSEILDSYAKIDNRIVVVHNKNMGPSAARNCGIDRATMPFITFVDSDDTIDFKMYSEMIKTITANELDCVCCNYKKVFSETKKINIKSRFENRILYNEEICEEIIKCLIGFSDENSNCLCSLVNKIFRLDVINKNNIRLNEKRAHGEDWLFCIEYYSLIKSIGFLKDTLYNYVFRDASLVSRPRKNVFELAVETNKRFKKLFPELEWESEKKIREENNQPIESAFYYRKMFKGSERKELLNKIYLICKENDYYKDESNLNEIHKKLKKKLDKNDVSGFTKCLMRATNKDYTIYIIKKAIKFLIRRRY